jgi:hypothetical protein
MTTPITGMADSSWSHQALLPIRVATDEPQSPDGLVDIYRKGLRGQWDAQTDLDWSHVLTPENPLQMHDGTNPLADTPIWRKLSPAQQTQVRCDLQRWHISQILHGERASMLCAGKVMLSSTDATIKACAAVQAVDEARHVEVYERLLAKIGPAFTVSPSLKTLLDNVLSDSDEGITALGMQILVEGLALAFFKSLQRYSSDPLTRSLLELVMRDEARHFAVGQITLQQQHVHLSQAELARREDFTADACGLLHDYLFADEVWAPLGLPARECAEHSRNSKVNRAMHRMLFRHLTPAIRNLGLLGPRMERRLDEMGVLHYAAFPI